MVVNKNKMVVMNKDEVFPVLDSPEKRSKRQKGIVYYKLKQKYFLYSRNYLFSLLSGASVFSCQSVETTF